MRDVGRLYYLCRSTSTAAGISAGVFTASTEGTEREIVASTTGIVSGSAKDGKSLYAVCASCHGADGAGNKALNAPRISGQKEWYIARQLANFKAGIRGSHEDDIYGQQMRPMSMMLVNEQAIANISAYAVAWWLEELYASIVCHHRYCTVRCRILCDAGANSHARIDAPQ